MTSVVEAVYTASNDEVGVARFSKKKLLFDIYNNEGAKTHNQFTILENKEYFIAKLQHDDLLKIFTIYSPKKTERIINCYILDLGNKSLKKINLFKTVIEKRQGLFSGQNKRQTNWAISPNKAFFVFATDNIKKNSNSYKVHVFDSESMDLVYETTFFENTEHFFSSYDIAIDNDAKVYSIGKEYKNGRRETNYTDGNPNYEIILNKISKDNTIVERIKLDENQHITDLKIIQKENQLNLYSFYSEKIAGRITGVNKFIVDKQDISIIESKKSKLPIEVFSDLYEKEKAEKKKEKELRSYYLDYVLEDDKGNTILMAEQFYITEHYVNNGVNGGYWVTTSHYDDILIVKLNNEGEITWGRSILKRATRPSYNGFLLDKKLHVLLNTGKKLKIKEDGRVKASKRFLESTALYNYIYEENGDVSQEKIRENAGKTTFVPFLGNYHNRKFIMFNKSRDEKKVMILTAK